MAKPDQSDLFEAKIGQTAHLFFAGANVLHTMLKDGDAEGRPGFDEWAGHIRSTSELHPDMTTGIQLIWLWDALRTSPVFRNQFGELPPAAAPWGNKQQRFDVFEPGEWFVIGMKPGEVASILQRADDLPENERVFLRTRDRLQMVPGSGGRLRCCDCHVDVMIRVDNVLPLEREAVRMSVEESAIELCDNLVRVQVASLNQAYTVASRRLEPNRRNHGGRVYDHIIHARQGRRTRLEEIREIVEADQWQVPPALTESNSFTPRSLFD